MDYKRSSSSTCSGTNAAKYKATVSTSSLSSREDEMMDDGVIRFNFDSDEERPIVEGFDSSSRIVRSGARDGDEEGGFDSGRLSGGHCSRIMAVMNAMRKQKDFCDVALLIDKVAIKAHRAVLAAASPAFMEMFHQHSYKSNSTHSNGTDYGGSSMSSASNHHSKRRIGECDGNAGSHSIYNMSSHFDAHTVEQLIEYAYTGKLVIKKSELENIYFTADRLQMQSIVDACSKHLVKSMNHSNCLEIRKLLWKSTEHVEAIDEYIRQHFDDITHNGLEFENLPCLKIELKGNPSIAKVCDERLVRNILTWTCEQIKFCGPSEVLDTHFILSIDGEKCRSIDDLVSDEFREEVSAQTGEQVALHELTADQFTILSHDKVVNSNSTESHVSFDLVHVEKRQNGRLIGLAIIKNSPPSKRLLRNDDSIDVYAEKTKVELIAFIITPKWMTLSTSNEHFSSGTSCSADAANFSTNTFGVGSDMSRREPLLPPLTMGRSGFGLVKTNNNVVLIVGGFNSGSCFRTIEYCQIGVGCGNGGAGFGDKRKAAVQWLTFKPEMKSRRARGYVFCTEDKDHNGTLYAISGGDGTKTLASVEKLKMPLMLEPSSPSSSSQQNRCSWTTDNDIRIMFEKAAFHYVRRDSKLYSIGGLETANSRATDKCYVNRILISNETGDESWSGWQRIANMNEGRYEASVISEDPTLPNSKLYVFGGNDGWKCKNSCEVYDPVNDRWSMLPRMPECNRCCQLAKLGQKIYLIGGTDGSSTSGTVHIFDCRSEEWSRGPSLNVKRTNFGIVEIDELVHVIGGFDGTQFLRSVEVLDSDLKMWTIVSESSRRQISGDSNKSDCSPTDTAAAAANKQTKTTDSPSLTL